MNSDLSSDPNLSRGGNKAHRLLHAMASEARERHQRTASVCPQWLQMIGSQVELSPVRMCGVTVDNLANASENPELISEGEKNVSMRTMDRVHSLLKNSSTREGMSHNLWLS